MGWLQNMRQSKEIKREMKFRRGKARINRYIQKSQEAKKKYWELGKKALKLGDRRQFQQLARAFQWTLEQINRWERYLIQLETVAARRDQVSATAEFMNSMKALSKSMLAGVSPEKIADMQVDLEKALAKAETLEETLDVVMDSSSDAIFASGELSEESIGEIEKAMMGETVHEEKVEAVDTKIDEGLKRIEDEMRKELK